MTLEEFDKVGFYPGLKVLYNGEVFPLIGVNFYERLIAYKSPEGTYDWVRCENCEIIEEDLPF